jgi:hypothetical protein
VGCINSVPRRVSGFLSVRLRPSLRSNRSSDRRSPLGGGVYDAALGREYVRRVRRRTECRGRYRGCPGRPVVQIARTGDALRQES